MSEIEHIPKDATYDGMLMYTDGSADQSKGIIGWAAHGYLYNNEVPKRGSGHPKIIPTKLGYGLKSDAQQKMVSAVGYFNIIGSTTEQGSNNTAEVKGFLDGLKFARDYRVKHILVRPDSEYVINGFTKWLPSWVKNNYTKATGEPIANKEVWREVMATYSDLLNNGVKIDFKWVKGHSGEFGNNMVDKFAFIGRSKSTEGETSTVVTTHKAEGFFKATRSQHPLICMKSILFSTDPAANFKNAYIMTNQTKVEEMVGRNDTDAAVAYCELKETDPLIDVIQARQLELANDVTSLVMLRYDWMFAEGRAEDLINFAAHTLKRPHKHRVDLYFVTDKSFMEKDVAKRKPITQDLVPVMLADRVWKAGTALEGTVSVMKGYRENPNLPFQGGEVVDITDFLFKQTTDKKGALTFDLNERVTNTFRELVYKHNTRGRETDFRLVAGLHIPVRNTLKKMTEAKELKAWMILEHVSGDAERYVTVFYIDGEWLAYAAYSANLVIHKT